jgi:uncharacterized integral membrane protein (TIGR00698 family)
MENNKTNTIDKISFWVKYQGILLPALLAVPAWWLGHALPVVGSPVFGILFGMLLAFWNRPDRLNEGIRFTSKKLLQAAIVLLGFGMNMRSIFKVGSQTLVLMLITISVTLTLAVLAGKLLRIGGKTATLIGVGTAICGGSAIAAAAPVIDADNEEVAQAISTIFLFNVIAALVFPSLGRLLAMSDFTFGIWAGTAVNDTSSVVAAGYSFSNAAGDLAVIVKLTRTLMIIPVSLLLAFLTSRQSAGNQTSGKVSLVKIFPWFVLGFLAAALINTGLALPVVVTTALAQSGKFLIVMAMAAIGLNTRLTKLIRSGGRPVLLGLICWLTLAIVALITQTQLFGPS